MRKKPICQQKKLIAQSRLFTIEQLDLLFANGEQRLYERVVNHGCGAALIVALTEDDSLLLIREYAAGTDTYELAFPKGLIEKDEPVLEAANRELREETGFAASELIWLRSMSMSPGYFSSRIELIFARGLYHSPLLGDEPEPIEVVPWPLAASDELLQQSDFSEARSIAALLLVKQWLEKEKNNE